MGRRERKPKREGRPWRSWTGGWFLLVLMLQAACATGVPGSRLRVETTGERQVPPGSARQRVKLMPSSDFAPVQIAQTEVNEALARAVLQQRLKVSAREAPPGGGRVRWAAWAPGEERGRSVEEGYARGCEDRGRPGDCLFLMGTDKQLGAKGRFMLGVSLALAPALEAAGGELRQVSAQAMTSLLLGLSLYLIVLMAPELASKGLAVGMTLWLWGYLGSELWGLIEATGVLWKEAREASTYGELRGAGERYGRVLGPNTLRLLLLVATWQVGEAGGGGMKGMELPSMEVAAANAREVGGFELAEAASEAEEVSVAGGQLTLTLPAGAAAVWAMQGQEGEGHIHHIATVKNNKSTQRGGPWTPKLKDLFDKAGMSMEDEANKVRVPGHQGPHPEEYHARVYERLKNAVKGCETTVQCREALTGQLEKLAGELRQVGSKLNKLVTRAEQG